MNGSVRQVEGPKSHGVTGEGGEGRGGAGVERESERVVVYPASFEYIQGYRSTPRHQLTAYVYRRAIFSLGYCLAQATDRTSQLQRTRQQQRQQPAPPGPPRYRQLPIPYPVSPPCIPSHIRETSIRRVYAPCNGLFLVCPDSTRAVSRVPSRLVSTPTDRAETIRFPSGSRVFRDLSGRGSSRSGLVIARWASL